MRTRSVIPAALLLCGCGLRHRPAAPEPARGPARDSLFRLDQSRGDTVAERGLAAGALALLASNVVYLRAGAPVVYGREGAGIVLALPETAGAPISWEPLGGGISDDLNSAFTYGVAARPSRTTPAIRLERYIAFWQRSRGQPWRITAYVEVGGGTGAVAALPPAYLTPVLQPLPKPQDEARANVRAADSLFSDLAYRMGTAYAFSNTVADEGILFGTPALLIGPRAVRESFELRTDAASLTWKPVYAAVAGSRDLGFTVGEYISTGRGPSGAAVQRFGKYLTVWKRQKDGHWKFVADAGNESPAR